MHLARVGVGTHTTIHPSIIRSLDATDYASYYDFKQLQPNCVFLVVLWNTFWFRCKPRTHFNDQMWNMDFVPTKWYKIFPFRLFLILLRIVYICVTSFIEQFTAGNMEQFMVTVRSLIVCGKIYHIISFFNLFERKVTPIRNSNNSDCFNWNHGIAILFYCELVARCKMASAIRLKSFRMEFMRGCN